MELLSNKNAQRSHQCPHHEAHVEVEKRTQKRGPMAGFLEFPEVHSISPPSCGWSHPISDPVSDSATLVAPESASTSSCALQTVTGLTLTAQNFSSACPEMGSRARWVKLLIALNAPLIRPQWKGTKQAPRVISPVTRACATNIPRRDLTSTKRPSVIPAAAASSG